MPTFYSDHFTETGAGQTSLPVEPIPPSAGIAHARLRKHIARISDPSDAAAAADVLRFCRLRSSWRIHAIAVSASAAWTGGTLDLGLHEAGTDHDGAVVDADLFASALDIATGFGRSDGFVESTTLVDEDRGKTVWELAAIGAASYTADPGIDFEITGTLGGTPAGPGEVVVEVYYTAGD